MATALDFAALRAAMRIEAAETAARAPAPRAAGADDAAARAAVERFRVSPSGLGADVFLVRDFVDEARAAALVAELESRPFCDLGTRALQNHGGVPSATVPMAAEPLPRFLAAVADDIEAMLGAAASGRARAPNHCLVNRYARGQGISPHFDGPLYDPFVAVLSLGYAVVMRFEPADPKLGDTLDAQDENGAAAEAETEAPAKPLAVVVPHRSLLVFERAAYTHARHLIPATRTFRLDGVANPHDAPVTNAAGEIADDAHATRYSLTFRRVVRVADREPLLTPEAKREAQRRLGVHLRGVSEVER